MEHRIFFDSGIVNIPTVRYFSGVGEEGGKSESGCWTADARANLAKCGKRNI